MTIKDKKELIKSKATNFNNEIKKATSTAIIAAFSFLIALSWKDAITEYITKILVFSPAQGKLFIALIITVLCVIGMIISSKLLRAKEQ